MNWLSHQNGVSFGRAVQVSPTFGGIHYSAARVAPYTSGPRLPSGEGKDGRGRRKGRGKAAQRGGKRVNRRSLVCLSEASQPTRLQQPISHHYGTRTYVCRYLRCLRCLVSLRATGLDGPQSRDLRDRHAEHNLSVPTRLALPYRYLPRYLVYVLVAWAPSRPPLSLFRRPSCCSSLSTLSVLPGGRMDSWPSPLATRYLSPSLRRADHHQPLGRIN